MSHRSLRPRGFTLIELLTVLAIIVVLVSIAYPGYAQYAQRARRSAARAVLLESAQFMERYYSARNTYVADASLTPLLAPSLPDALQYAPAGATRAEATHAISVDKVSAIDYTLKATSLKADPCGDLTLDSTGVRGSTGGPSVEACWR